MNIAQMGNSAILIIFAMVALGLLFERLIVRGEDRRRLTDLKPMRIYSIILNSLLIGSLTFVALSVDTSLLFFQLALVILVLFAVTQAFLEKRYLPNTCRHIATLLNAGSIVLMLGSMILLHPFA
ncbi:hypothetical protein [Saccharibacillus sacchari]|uniref:Uncharacterized protein n=1 Tax=Saccharibacillus sacchari TaxID=456493 RepID=A0ACC6PK67_9BACL